MNVISNDSSKLKLAIAPLYHVYDPEIGLNVVDLGLIYQIDFMEEEKRIEASMTLTTQFCPMGESIMSNVTQALETTFPAYTVHVNLTFEPPWNHSMISEEGNEFLSR